MKHLIHILLLFTISPLHPFTTSAAVPLKWTVETSRAQPATFEAYQGETLDFEATLQSYGKPLELPVTGASSPRLFWQTNGMGSAYWSAPCTVPGASSPRGADTNLLRATWLPSYDVGARAYNCFIGLSNSIYHAAFQLRLRPSPGAVPNELPLPQKVIDFSQVTVLNPPWSGGGGSGGVDTNAVIDITTPLIATATNDLAMALNDPNTGKLGVHGDGDDLGQGEFTIRRHGTIILSPYDDYIFKLESNNLFYGTSGEAKFSVPGGFNVQYGDLNLEYGSTLKINGVDAISTNNPAFVSAVQSIAPSSPPSLRLYDEVRGCWWIGRMVNGVISWEVEE